MGLEKVVNKVILVGRIATDPKITESRSGELVAKFRLVTSSEGHGEDSFHNVVCFGKQAEFVKNYCEKGDQISVDGRLQERSYTPEGGETKYFTDVIASRVGDKVRPSGKGGGGGEGKGGKAKAKAKVAQDESFDEGIPF